MRGLLLATLCASLSLVACGLPGPATRSTAAPDTVAVYRELAQCIRSHGSPDFPDPLVDRHGNVDFPASAPQTSDATRQACRAIADRLPRASAAHAPTQAVIDRQKRFAQCMRNSGFPRWPDPNPDGSNPPPPDDYVQAAGVKGAVSRCQESR
ncbi:MAG: hypothetical protein M3Z97_14490 [Candidatus Dormibacteraeota bacterium]|nr:hypothetical protein [Candidatus Dormibacteraeota bacterium]